MRNALLLCLVLFLGMTWPHPPAKVQAAGDMLGTVLANIETSSRKLTGLQATISQQRTNQQLNIKDVKQVGTLIYKFGKDRKIRIDYTQPQPKVLAVTGDKGILFERDINQAYVTTVSKFTAKYSSFALLSVINSVAQLKASFNPTFVATENFNGQPASHLTLVPKTPSNYTKIDVWIDNRNWLPVRQIFYERNGDYVEVTLTNLQMNPSLSDRQFEVDLGKAKIIRG